MTKNKILHIMILDKFLAPFIDFVNEHFGRENHHYVFITSEKYDYGLTPEHNVEFLYTDDDIFITLLEYMKISKKIILHGLWRDKVDVLLYFNQDLLKKCYWMIWGGDFYFPETKSKIRHEIIKNMPNLLISVDDDIKLIRKWYMAKGNHIKLFLGYPSNLYNEYNIKTNLSGTINILIGNSATSTNNHFEIFEKLLPFRNEKIMLYIPLSYGDKEYAKEVIEYGKKIFGDKFIALTEFMSFEKYLEFLGSIDIAIFNHKRQQAMGNTITLLGLGKKVYLRSDSTLWNHFKNIGIRIFDINNIELKSLDKISKKNNQEKTKEYFSKDNLIKDCKSYFNNGAIN